MIDSIYRCITKPHYKREGHIYEPHLQTPCEIYCESTNNINLSIKTHILNYCSIKTWISSNPKRRTSMKIECSHSKSKTTRTTPPITRQSSKTKKDIPLHKGHPPLQIFYPNPNPVVVISYTKAHPQQISNNPLLYQLQANKPRKWPHAQPSRSETDLLDINMQVDPLSDSVTQINLSGILNKTIQPESQRDSPVDDGPARTTFIETKGKRLKAALTIIAKASHHKTFMETCPMRNSPP